VRGIDRAEFTLGNSQPHQFTHAAKDGLEIVFHQLVDVLGLSFAHPHHLPLHQLGIHLIGGDEIEIRAHISQYFFARPTIAIERAKHRGLHPRKRILEDRAVERLLILKVVIKESLVDFRLARNRVGACAGDAVFGELMCSSMKNRGAALLGLTARAKAM